MYEHYEHARQIRNISNQIPLMQVEDRRIVWNPPDELIRSSRLSQFIEKVNSRFTAGINSFEKLHAWSVQQRDTFWKTVLEFHEVIFSGNTDIVFQASGQHPLWGTWFPNVEINYAENLMRGAGDKPAIVSWTETGKRCAYSFDELKRAAGSVSQFFGSAGLRVGDRVCAFAPNIAETVVCMLATAARGAVWSSCSPDFGTVGALDRFSQIAPKILVVVDSYLHKGKKISIVDKIEELIEHLPTVEKVLVIPFDGISSINFPSFRFATKLSDYTSIVQNSGPLEFIRVPFAHPLFILYSSGTTGKPKCIIHSVGGTLLEHIKELSLHTDVKPEDRIFYQTTCGWMMWNFLVSSLALEASIVLYDGSPLHHEGRILWEMSSIEEISVFGTNAKYVATLEKERLHPRELFDYPRMNKLLSTGSPLTPQSFDFIRDQIKPSLQISSVSGGTDILGCFALGSPITPVRRGELQVRSLGLDVQVFDDSGKPLRDSVGELVCCNPFPSMPIGFFADTDRERFKKAYFEKFPDVWHHGDFAELTSQGGMRILGRSDSTLNPGGIRIGTAELYQQVEVFPDIVESLAVSFEIDGDSRVVLFVRLQPNHPLTEELVLNIKTSIKKNISPFHVPWKIVAAPDFPKTRNGKVMEAAVRNILRGATVTEMEEGMANPECLGFYRDWVNLNRNG